MVGLFFKQCNLIIGIIKRQYLQSRIARNLPWPVKGPDKAAGQGRLELN